MPAPCCWCVVPGQFVVVNIVIFMDLSKFRLDGKVALITGAGRGIGLAMGETLASAGCTVAIQDIDLAVAEASASGITQAGGRAIALGGDLTDTALPAKLVADIAARVGSIDILINNGGIQMAQPWMEMPVEDMRRQWDANVLVPILLCRLVVPEMKRKHWGRIVNIGSIQQRRGNPGMLAYSLSKATLERLTTALASELARDNITINCIAPGWINTHRNRADFPNPEEIQKKGKHIPLGRIGEPKDFGPITLTLCSEAGNYITGQTIYVDGGMSVH